MASSSTRWMAALALLLSAGARAQVGTLPETGYGPPTGCMARPYAGHPEAPLKIATTAAATQAGTDLHNGKMLSFDGRTRTLSIKEPIPNLGLEKYRAAEYADCTGANGCYWQDLDAQYRRAEDALADAVKHAKPGEKLALVMDIDETALSSYCEMKRDDFGYIPGLNDAWMMGPDAALAIPGALRLFKEASSMGVAVFFITGRPGVPDYSSAVHADDETQATARNLKAAGFEGYTGLRLRDGAENLMPTIEYKSGERQRISDQGYRIVMSVGDQWSDLEGVPQADVSVKLPNPFYFIP